MTSNQILDLIFYWILPLSVSLGAFFIFIQLTHISYKRADLDRVWKVALKIGIAIGILALLYVGWLFIKKIPMVKTVGSYFDFIFSFITDSKWIADLKVSIANIVKKVINFFNNWIPVYMRAFILVWVPGVLIWIQSLIWRIKFSRCLNIVVRTFFMFPMLAFRYFLGYQTPFFDYVQAKLYIAKIKENVSDSYFDALQEKDDTGHKFDNGQGGTVQNQKIKAAALAFRNTHATIRTANGVRHAQLSVKQSRETQTDQLIEQQLRGLGLRLSASSIRFQEDPILNPEKGGYIFDSDVPYNAGDALGSWLSIFSNPFSSDKRVANGGDGSISAIKNMYTSTVSYFIHLTPAAVYEKIKKSAKSKYTPDFTTLNAKYKTQQNLDLSVVPEPVDPDTGETVEMLTEKAVAVAKDRVADITDFLTRAKMNVSFERVLVGGNTAVYEYTLSRSANLPLDWNKLQEGLANFMKINDIPVFRIEKGNLLITMVNKVNIPVDFRKMILNRPKGTSDIISGIAGVDGLGNTIDFNLGDKNPHAMLFGKTGTGKTVLIMNILYSIMSATDPDHLRIYFIDGKGNSFEFMRTDNPGAPAYHPNPFVAAQPADGSGDIDYARGVVQHLVKECRRRIELFKQRGVSKLAEFNRKYPDEALPEILAVCDEFSTLTDSDNFLKASELAEKSMTDSFEYLAKMARSTGIRMLLANQTARKEKVPGRITANITGRVSLGVTEPIESDIALPASKVNVSLISQPGEFYSAMHGPRNLQHGNTPYLSDDVLYALNDSLEKKFGHRDYLFTREEIMAEMDDSVGLGDEETRYNYPIPAKLPTKDTHLTELIPIISQYPEWAVANQYGPIFKDNVDVKKIDDSRTRRHNFKKLNAALENAAKRVQATRAAENADTRKAVGAEVAAFTAGNDKGSL